MATATLNEYVGRTSDYLAFYNIDFGVRELRQELVSPGNQGSVITGIEKLVQRVLIELLTEAGSTPYFESRGTLLMTQLRAGLIRTNQELLSAFAGAASDVIRNLRLEADAQTDPLDERISSLEIESATITQDKAVITAVVRSLAGESRQVLFPLTVVPNSPF